MSIRMLFASLLLLACSSIHAAVPDVILPDGNHVQLKQSVLQALPRQSVSATAHGKTARYDGYSLLAVLKAAGVSPVQSLRGKNLRLSVRISAADGYQAVFALAELDPTIGNRQVLLVDRENGASLPAGDGPWRLVVPADGRPARWARQVTSIAVSAP